jgi:hypothetical protein
MAYRGIEVGHLQWIDEANAMEAWTAEGELVGQYPTRHEAASALWKATAGNRWKIKNAALAPR